MKISNLLLITLSILSLHQSSLLAGEIIADSQEDYSSEQGHAGWSYGSGYGDTFSEEGWRFDEELWVCDKGVDIGKGILGGTGYTQVFWNSSATVTRSWKSSEDISKGTISVSMSSPCGEGNPLRLQVFLNDTLLGEKDVETTGSLELLEALSVNADIKRGDVIYFTLSSTGNNNDFTNCGFKAVISR